MKIIPYSKSNFVRLKMFHEKWEHNIKYEVDSLSNEIRNEVTSKSEFGKTILRNLNQKNGVLEREHQKKLWKQILNKSTEIEFLFLILTFSKENFEILLESAKELEIEIQVVLNLFLSEEEIGNKARIFSKNHESSESIPEEEFVKKVLNREQRRISIFEEIKNLVKVVNINSDCSEIEIVQNILKEIKIDYNIKG